MLTKRFKKTLNLLSVFLVICLILSLTGANSFYSAAVEAATLEEKEEAMEKGFAWLVDQQNTVNGSWPEGRDPGTTALAVTALMSYAKYMELTPLDPDFLYADNIRTGLDYIFLQAQRDDTNNWINWGASQIYVLGPCLMAISATEAPDEIVDVPASGLDGLTYLQVAEEVVNYIYEAQVKSGPGIGLWYYSAPTTRGDMSISGWMTLGLGYAKEKMSVEIPEQLLDNLDEGIDIVQWTDDPDDPMYGGAGYTSSSTVENSYNNWINIHKVGHLLSMMELVGDSAASERVQHSVAFIERHWNAPNSGVNGYPAVVNDYFDVGWRGGPGDVPSPLPSYIATVSVMKGLLALGIDTIFVEDAPIDWQFEFDDVIVANQSADGYWDQGGYPPSSYGPNYRNYSTIWALMTMLRAVPTIAVNGVSLNTNELTLSITDDPVTLIAAVTPADATNPNVFWNSSDETVAIVVDGVVTPLSPGTTVISVTTEDGGFVAECVVTVLAEYSVTYDANMGIGEVVDENSPYLEGETVTVLENAFSKAGYIFASWNTMADGSGTAYNAGDTFVIEEDIVLYAQYTAIETPAEYSVTYDANTGEGVLVDENSPYLQGESVTVLANTFSKADHVSAGWNTKADGSGTAYNAGDTFIIVDDIVLYAQYTPVIPQTGENMVPTLYTLLVLIIVLAGVLLFRRKRYIANK